MSAVVKAKEPADESAEGAFDVVEQMPEFPGGSIELMKFLSENIKYPEAASKAGTQGRVVAQFIVEADGSITNVKVLKKVSDEIDAEAVRVGHQYIADGRTAVMVRKILNSQWSILNYFVPLHR